MNARHVSYLGLLVVTVCSSTFAQNASNEGIIARPSWATQERFRGRIDGATPITLQVHLPLRNAEETKAELEAVSDPDSPRYGQHLTARSS
jgi:Pro-kumamolisin, activation domain